MRNKDRAAPKNLLAKGGARPVNHPPAYARGATIETPTQRNPNAPLAPRRAEGCGLHGGASRKRNAQDAAIPAGKYPEAEDGRRLRPCPALLRPKCHPDKNGGGAKLALPPLYGSRASPQKERARRGHSMKAQHPIAQHAEIQTKRGRSRRKVPPKQRWGRAAHERRPREPTPPPPQGCPRNQLHTPTNVLQYP